MKNLKSGFTLVELVVVMLIIGILSAVAITKVSNSDKVAYETSMKADAKNILAGILNLYASEQSYPDRIELDQYDSNVASNLYTLTINNNDSSISVACSPYSRVTYIFTPNGCTNSSDKFYLKVENKKLNNSWIDYDSCEDSSLQMNL